MTLRFCLFWYIIFRPGWCRVYDPLASFVERRKDGRTVILSLNFNVGVAFDVLRLGQLADPSRSIWYITNQSIARSHQTAHDPLSCPKSILVKAGSTERRWLGFGKKERRLVGHCRA